MMRRLITYPALALGSTLLWGAIEVLALLRSRWLESRRPRSATVAIRRIDGDVVGDI